MRKLAIGTVILVTAIVTFVITSAFWLIAFNGGALGPGAARDAPEAENVITETTEPDSNPQLVLGPSGLAVPVAGIAVEDLVDTFQQSRADGARVHNAIDIMAPAGTPVVAAAEGLVEKLYFSEGGGGISVYVRSPDRQWLYYYAHLQDYAPGLREGQRVERGDRLGSVGTTGNAGEAGPHLHFAVHQMGRNESWHEGTPVNPYPLLAGQGRAR
ncbi:MAG TPA: M23 family metallopeptidase [Allosphingosinicella sp.]|nr:M23 family metallopeptidase [Allosphingosinicella sp.]